MDVTIFAKDSGNRVVLEVLPAMDTLQGVERHTPGVGGVSMATEEPLFWSTWCLGDSPWTRKPES